MAYIQLLLVVICIMSVLDNISSFRSQLSSFNSFKPHRQHSISILHTKKRSESKERKGFGKSTDTADTIKLLDVSETSTTNSNSTIFKNDLRSDLITMSEDMGPMKMSVPSTTSPSSSSSSSLSQKQAAVKSKVLNENMTEKDVFQKYGIKNGDDKDSSNSNSKGKKNKSKKSSSSSSSNSKEVDAPFGESILERIPLKTQAKFDSALITATFLSLTFVVITGVAISFGAFKVVYPEVTFSADLDNIITNVLAPAFTPALGVFFLFSITFGLFKFAQVSSDQTVYKE